MKAEKIVQICVSSIVGISFAALFIFMLCVDGEEKDLETQSESLYEQEKVSFAGNSEEDSEKEKIGEIESTEVSIQTENGNDVKLYVDFLRHVHDNPGEYVESLGGDPIEEVEQNFFAIGDIDLDGKKELMIRFPHTYNAAQYAGIWKAKGDYVEEYARLGESCQFYKDGTVKVEAGHNQSPGDAIWPYTLQRYDEDDRQYKGFASAYSADEDFANGREYYSELDEDQDGVLYYFAADDEEYVPLTLEEYQEKVNQYIPDENIIDLEWKTLTYRNIDTLL